MLKQPVPHRRLIVMGQDVGGRHIGDAELLEVIQLTTSARALSTTPTLLLYLLSSISSPALLPSICTILATLSVSH